MNLALHLLLWLAQGLLLLLGSVTIAVSFMLTVARVLARRDEMDEYQAQVFAGFRPSWSRRCLGYVIEVLIASFDLALRLGWSLRILRQFPDPGSGTPIVLLPGYTENAGAMWWIARRLRRRGFRPILVDFPSTFSRIQRNVDFLRQELRAICERTGSERVAVVAHSMGGVVTRTLLLSDPHHPVLSLIALSSPFRGTHTAKLGALFRLGESVIDMSPGSPFGHMFLPSARATVRIHAIVGEQENIVSPPWSVVLPGHDTHLLSLPVGHDAPLFLKEAFDCIERWLVQDGVLRADSATPSVVDRSSTVQVLQRPHQQIAHQPQHHHRDHGR